MQLFQDLAILDDIVKKNEKTKALLKHSKEKVGVVEET